MRCANCGGELPGPTRFCPHCSAPQPEFEGAAEAPRSTDQQLDETAVAAPERSRWASAHASAVLVFLAAAIVGFAVMAIALGWIGKDLLGL